MLKKEIGLRIKYIRETMGYTKEKLAKMLGVSGQYLGMVEHGKGCLSIDQITNLSADYILFGKDYSLPASAQKALDEYSEEQIISGCETLEKLALFIKNL
mgnify:CR=1 FL=1